MSIKLVVFDYEGTLVDSKQAMVQVFTECARKHKLPIPSSELLRSLQSTSLRSLIKQAFPDLDTLPQEKLQEFYQTCQEGVLALQSAPTPLAEGAKDGLQRLVQDGYKLGIATSRGAASLLESLRYHGIDDLFVYLSTPDSGPAKPHPSAIMDVMTAAEANAGQTLMVGDTVYDVQAAQNANVPAIGVNWGYQSSKTLTEAGAQKIVKTFPELEQLIRNWPSGQAA